jgi:hypothetical protein
MATSARESGTEGMQQPVKKRDVIFVCGYEISRPEAFHRRFAKELPLFEAAWNVKVDLSPPSVDDRNSVAIWTMKTRGANWQVDVDYRMFWWGDIIAPDFELSNLRRFYVGVLAFLDFTFSGALFAYFRTNWRYALFFLYPYVLMTAAGYAGFYVTRWLLGGGILVDLIAVIAGFVCAFALVALPPRPFYIGYLLNDWYFAHDLVHRRRVHLDQRLDGFARELVEIAGKSTADEIVIVGHSLGAVQAIDVVSRAKRLDPQFGKNGAPIRIMTIGSSLLKIGLHPKAVELRAAVAAVAGDPDIYWVEFQAMTDIVNFYKSDPVTDLGLPPAGKPIVQIVRIRHMLNPGTYKSIKRDFFRVHRQFVMGNEQRYFYDYYMICCGPVALPQRVVFHEGAVEAFGPDGSFNPVAVEAGRQSGSKLKERKAS